MYYISDYRKKSMSMIVPYLIEFPQIVKIIEQNSDRYQAIEDLLWNVATNFRIDDSRGVFLNAWAHNECTEILFTDVADDAFTYTKYGTKDESWANKRGYNKGHYYNQVAYASGIKKDVSEEKLIRAVKAQIIKNNTNTSIEDFIEAMKLYFNAESIYISESHPLGVTLKLIGSKLDLSTSGNYEIVKSFLPACVLLRGVYADTKEYNEYAYNGLSDYGKTSFPIDLSKNPDFNYRTVNFADTLHAENQEYIKTNCLLNNKDFCVVFGKYVDTDVSTLINCVDLEVGILHNEENTPVFGAVYNNTEYFTDMRVFDSSLYTVVLYNDNNTLKIWFIDGISLRGESLMQDNSLIKNRINNTEPDLIIENYETNDKPIYLNCKYMEEK